MCCGNQNGLGGLLSRRGDSSGDLAAVVTLGEMAKDLIPLGFRNGILNKGCEQVGIGVPSALESIRLPCRTGRVRSVPSSFQPCDSDFRKFVHFSIAAAFRFPALSGA